MIKYVRQTLFVLFIMLVLCFADKTELTIYNDNLGLVRQQREIVLTKGQNEIKFTDVATKIDATSVHFKSLTAPNQAAVVEQNYEYDLVSRDKLLNKYIDKEIELVRRFGSSGEKTEILRGTLLSLKGGMTLKVGDKIYSNPSGEIILDKLPEGLITKPTLSWLVNCDKPGKHKVEVGYLTEGIKWNADYVVVIDTNDKSLDLNGWVSIDNQTGQTYKDAKLKLIAGDINRVKPSGTVKKAEMVEIVAARATQAPQFQEKTFFEYHMYTLQRPATIKDNETKQIEFTSASNVPAKKLFIYDGARMPFYGYSEQSRADMRYGVQTNKEVFVMMEFKNSKENNMGIPIPKGRVRVYKSDVDQSLEFIGEDRIDHTPKDEIIRIYLGNAFDIVGERIQTDFKTVGYKTVTESYKITLRNHKEEPVVVRVVEHLYRWSNWKITKKSQNYEKTDSKTIEFNVPIEKNSEAEVTYTVEYWW